MAIHDRWYKDEQVRDPETGSMVRTGKQVRSAEYGCDKRWQVRWRDAHGAQKKKSFAKKQGKNPNVHAEAFNNQVLSELAAGTYVDPKTAETTFEAFSEEWRQHRTHGQTTAGKLERSFRLHVYESDDPKRRGRTRRGGPALGHHSLRELDARPSLSQAWIAGLNLGPGTAAGVIDRVSSVYNAAVDDGIMRRNPLLAKSITKPTPPNNEAVPFTMAQIDALTWALRHKARCREDCCLCEPNRFDILPDLGVNTGMRQGELFGLAIPDIDFLHREIKVQRQVKLVDGMQVFSEIKNDKIHTVPITEELCNLIAFYMQLFPPVAVTLPLEEDGEVKDKTATHTLLLTRPGGLAMHREGVNGRWKSALKQAGIEVVRERMMHCLRHTAVSVWLSHGLGTPAVAEFIGDTEHTVSTTYSHMMPNDRDKARQAMQDFMRGGAQETAQGSPEMPAVRIVP